MATWPAQILNTDNIDVLHVSRGVHGWSPGIVTSTGDATDPTINNFSPSPGTPINRSDAIAFDVTDASGLLRSELFVVLGSEVLVVHDGEKFRGRFSNLSTRTVITDGYRYSVRPNGGWTQAPTFEVHAVDTDGNEA